MKAKWRWYELLLPGLREFAKGVQKMKTLDEYYKLILISMVIVVFLPLTTLMAEDEWEVAGQYSLSYQTGDLYYGWDGHMYKEIDITEYLCDREFYEDDSGFQMAGEWGIYVEAEVGSDLEDYSNTIELDGQTYHFCQQD
jgi:hypothetical protein